MFFFFIPVKNFKVILPFGLAMTTMLLAAIVCFVLTEKRIFGKATKIHYILAVSYGFFLAVVAVFVVFFFFFFFF